MQGFKILVIFISTMNRFLHLTSVNNAGKIKNFVVLMYKDNDNYNDLFFLIIENAGEKRY